jgi:hypothetical protein
VKFEWEGEFSRENFFQENNLFKFFEQSKKALVERRMWF